MVRLSTVFLAFGIPILAVVALMLNTAYTQPDYAVPAVLVPVVTAANVIYIGAPQIIFFAIAAVLKFRPPVVLFGLLAADIWLVWFEWVLLRTPGTDSMGWLFYWLLCLPALLVGVLIGFAVCGLTKRWS